MVTFLRTDSSNPDFLHLVHLLDADLRVRDGDEHSFFAPFNTLDNIKDVIVAYSDGRPIGCGAFRTYAVGIAEIKRMFVHPDYRGRGIASLMLSGLEKWARENNFQATILETGYNQPEAIALYKKSGYSHIPNYGPYEHIQNSVCFRKELPLD